MLLRCCVLLIMLNYEGMSWYPLALNILQGVDRKVNPFFLGRIGCRMQRMKKDSLKES
jgi:hypothetical protein